MRIGVDATCWANDRGYGRFTRELVRAMVSAAPQHEFICLLDARAAERFDLDASNVRTVVAEQHASPTLAASAESYRSPRDMFRLTAALRRAAVNVAFFPSVYTFFPVPLGVPAVVTLHDAIAERFPHLTLPSARARLFWRAKVRLAIWQSKVILTVSDYAASEISACLRVPPARIRVALEAPSPAYRPSAAAGDIVAAAARAGVPPGRTWVTYVGGFNPHKNLDVLVEAHAAVARRLSPPPYLVLIGTVSGDVFHGSVAAIRERIRTAGTDELIRWTGFLPDEEIRHLHSGAAALVLPSASEGFGLPAVEAAACGTPVIATTASPLPELLAGGGVFVAPGDVAALADAIEQLVTNASMRDRLGTCARLKAGRLSWARGARAALEAIEAAAA